MLVARQPIYDRQLKVAAYELLFRDDGANRAVIGDDDVATSQVLLGAFTEIGLKELVGERPAFLNVSTRFVVEGYALPLPRDQLVLELLERAPVTDELIGAMRRLRRDGYTIALDDFELTDATRPLLDLADIVKIDVLAVPRPALPGVVAELAPFGVQLLAEKVETHEDFEFCHELGFDLFQGYFFCKPKIVVGRGIPANRLTTIRLVSRMNEPGIDVGQLEDLISHDVGLSYRLLRYINSAFFGLRREITSVRQALFMLGLENIRRWATLLALAGVEDKPHELLVTALLRARMCELLAPTFGEPEGEALFTVGLFSVIDALMDASMEEVLASLPFSDDVVQALLHHEGPKGRALHCVLACERGDVEEARRGAAADALLGALPHRRGLGQRGRRGAHGFSRRPLVNSHCAHP
jgi:EAL and modified HD-GYP domain-containing signal transduction protein